MCRAPGLVPGEVRSCWSKYWCLLPQTGQEPFKSLALLLLSKQINSSSQLYIQDQMDRTSLWKSSSCFFSLDLMSDVIMMSSWWLFFWRMRRQEGAPVWGYCLTGTSPLAEKNWRVHHNKQWCRLGLTNLTQSSSLLLLRLRKYSNNWDEWAVFRPALSI